MGLIRASLGLVALAMFGCAGHVPEPKPHPDAPHISWAISEGNNDKEVCRSTQDAACTLNLSGQPRDRRIGVFHVFLHAGSVDTKYVGSVDIGFLVEPGPGHVHAIDRVVARHSGPVNFSTTGNVKPAGTYYVTVKLAATAADGSGAAVPITARVRVDVK